MQFRVAMERSKLAFVLLCVTACGGLVEPTVDDPDTGRVDAPRSPSGTSPPSTLQGDVTYVPAQKMECPEEAPADDDWCPRPLSCSYEDTCSQRPAAVSATRQYECTGSRWTRRSEPYAVTCPKALPANGDPCEPACEYEPSCTYETTCGAASAQCQRRSGTWYVSGRGAGCADADAGASGEAGG
jgi:hypothetical protein